MRGADTHDPLDRASERELVDGIEQLTALWTTTHAHLLRFVSAYDQRVGGNDVHVAVAALIDAPIATARKWVEVARALRSLPRIAARFESGALSFDKVCALADVATPETDAELAASASELSVADLRRAAKKLETAGAVEPTDDHPDRHLHYRWSPDHTKLTLGGELYGVGADVFVGALERAIDDLPRDADGSYGLWAHRAADALVNLAEGSGGDTSRPIVTVNADLSLVGGGGGVAETAAGTPLHPDVVARLTCDCSVEVALHDRSGRVVGVGRKTRTPPPWLRRQVVKRDRHCRFPGCTNARFLDVHHLRHWGTGGPTDLDNLGLLCRGHHTLVHRKMLKLELDPATGDMACLKPDGTPYANGPPPLRDDIRVRFFGPLVPAFT